MDIANSYECPFYSSMDVDCGFAYFNDDDSYSVRDVADNLLKCSAGSLSACWDIG